MINKEVAKEMAELARKKKLLERLVHRKVSFGKEDMWKFRVWKFEFT